jgi:hypothetical protein
MNRRSKMDKSKQGRRVCTSQPAMVLQRPMTGSTGSYWEGTYYYGHRACGCRDLGSMVSITEFWDALHAISERFGTITMCSAPGRLLWTESTFPKCGLCMDRGGATFRLQSWHNGWDNLIVGADVAACKLTLMSFSSVECSSTIEAR